MSYPYDSCLWAGEIGRNTETYGSDWWRYEQTAYYTDGLLRLGYLLGDREMIAKAEEGIRYTLANASSTGVLGNKAIESMWPMCVYFRVLQAYYERTGDPAIPAALERHYMNLRRSRSRNGATSSASRECCGLTAKPAMRSCWIFAREPTMAENSGD